MLVQKRRRAHGSATENAEEPRGRRAEGPSSRRGHSSPWDWLAKLSLIGRRVTNRSTRGRARREEASVSRPGGMAGPCGRALGLQMAPQVAGQAPPGGGRAPARVRADLVRRARSGPRGYMALPFPQMCGPGSPSGCGPPGQGDPGDNEQAWHSLWVFARFSGNQAEPYREVLRSLEC